MKGAYPSGSECCDWSLFQYSATSSSVLWPLVAPLLPVDDERDDGLEPFFLDRSFLPGAGWVAPSAAAPSSPGEEQSMSTEVCG